jgi:hypothetical protein
MASAVTNANIFANFFKGWEAENQLQRDLEDRRRRQLEEDRTRKNNEEQFQANIGEFYANAPVREATRINQLGALELAGQLQNINAPAQRNAALFNSDQINQLIAEVTPRLPEFTANRASTMLSNAAASAANARAAQIGAEARIPGLAADAALATDPNLVRARVEETARAQLFAPINQLIDIGASVNDLNATAQRLNLGYEFGQQQEGGPILFRAAGTGEPWAEYGPQYTTSTAAARARGRVSAQQAQAQAVQAQARLTTAEAARIRAAVAVARAQGADQATLEEIVRRMLQQPLPTVQPQPTQAAPALVPSRLQTSASPGLVPPEIQGMFD